MQADDPKYDGVICHLNLANSYRGGERQTELLIRELAERGQRQRLVIRTGNQLRRYCGDVRGLEIREVHANPLSAALAVRGCSIAHAHEARTVYSGLLARRMFGVPYLFTRRVVAPQRASISRAVAYRQASRVVAISASVANNVSTLYPDIRPVIIPDAHADFGFDAEEVAAIRSRYRGKTLIGNVGALVHSHKGQSTIIAAAKLAATRYPDWHFLICGSGADEQRYRREIGDLENIELLGWIDNVGDYLAAFDVFLYPSLHEALGSVLLDALHFGLPIVASNVDGIPEIVRNDENGRLIPPEDPESILAEIAGLLSSPDELQAMRQRNRQRADEFSAASMADAYLALYIDAQSRAEYAI